jgi:CheY-like chemotaxis protein
MLPIRKNRWPSLQHTDIVRRTNILVVDDGDFPYMSLFKRDGYNVTKWETVKDTRQLENGDFDVILLDLFGVGLAESEEQGFGILKHIKETNPAQLVIAYSNAEWSLDYQPFFQGADAVLHKTKTDYFGFKREVDRFLDLRFSLGFYVDRAIRELGEYAPTVPRAKKKISNAIMRRDPSLLRGYLIKSVDDTVTIDRVIAVVGVAISAAQLWTS